LIAHVSAIFLLPVFEKSVIINDFRAIAHSISAREGGNTVCCNAMVRNRTDDDSVTYWFPWKHPMARRRGLERARRLGPIRASPFDLLSSTKLPQPKHWLGPSGLAFRALKMHQAPIFRPFDVRLAVSDMLRTTPTVRPR